MSPPYFFRIDEIRESPTATVNVDSSGHWIPPLEDGGSVRLVGGVTGKWWFCDRTRIHTETITQLPSGARPYSVYSIYYCSGYGFLILKGDAARPPPGESWHPLRFEHDDNDFSSYLTHAGQAMTLRCQRPDQQWPQMLLPDIYQSSSRTEHQGYGGLKGELPIFLALLAFSMARESLQQWLPHMFYQSTWKVHNLSHGRIDKRGVVVYVYTCPSNWAGGSTVQDLQHYEDGELGKYYN